MIKWTEGNNKKEKASTSYTELNGSKSNQKNQDQALNHIT